MKTIHIAFLVVAVIIIGSVLWASGVKKPPVQTPSTPPTLTEKATSTTATTTPPTLTVTSAKPMTTGTITTNKGIITVELFTEQAPKTVENFSTLAQQGFYNGTRFHRVIKSFMIQGGDPLSRDLASQGRWGQGGPGRTFADEINQNSPLYKTGYQRGILAMANSGPNTNGSQFFIMHQDYPLPPNYTIFGKVVTGLEVVDAIAETKTTGSPTDRPLEDMLIQKISINK